ncbi:MAG: MATE family efflux transporter [Lachnospiraceae bacterium]|nr:MATE family efflux transporter [Lachnospiraceae bacterium]
MSENKMGVMSEGKLLLNMSLPMMISMFVQALYNIVDSIFVAKISQDALTAVSLAFPMQSLMIAVSAGTGVGVNALISRSLGERKRKKANTIAVNGIFIYFLSYIVIAAIGALFSRPFYAMMIEPGQEAIAELGVQYLTIVMCGSFGIFAQMIFERILQSTGRTVLTMISQTLGAVINLILDPILIFGLFGLPAMGVAGAALATIAGQIIAGIVAFIFNIKFNTDIRISFKGFRPDGKIIKSIYQIAIPSIIMQSIGSFMTTGMNKILLGLDNDGTGAAVFGVYFKLQSFFFMPVFGLNNGMIPILAYNFGAGNKKRMMNTVKYACMIGFGACAVGFALFEFFPVPLLKLFDASDNMLTIGTHALKVIAFHYLAAWFCIIIGSLFQAVGKATYTMYTSVARQLVILLPAAYILAKIGGMNLIWWSLPIAEIMSLIMTLIFLRSTMKFINQEIAKFGGVL